MTDIQGDQAMTHTHKEDDDDDDEDWERQMKLVEEIERIEQSSSLIPSDLQPLFKKLMEKYPALRRIAVYKILDSNGYQHNRCAQVHTVLNYCPVDRVDWLISNAERYIFCHVAAGVCSCELLINAVLSYHIPFY